MNKNKKSTQQGKPGSKQRNRLALNPLMKKSHVYTKSAKADRVNAKQEVKRALAE